MATREKKLNLTERDGVLGVIISKDEYREYVELQAKRDRSEGSLRAQMRRQNQEKIDFAREVIRFLEKAGYENLSALVGESVIALHDRANEILAEE